MKKLLCTIILALFAAGTMLASVDGRWIAEVNRPKGKSKRGNETVQVVFDLKSDGDRLSGSVARGGKKARTAEIRGGTIAGNHVTFKTVQRSKKKGEIEWEWKGTVEGDELKLTRGTKSGRRVQELVAKRR
jgi:hypothetical protein